MSVNAVARQMGVSPATVAKWAKDAGQEVATQDAKPPADARAVAAFLLKKARAMASGVERLDSKAQMETMTAVEKAINSFLKLETGNANEGDPGANNTQVNIVLNDLLR